VLRRGGPSLPRPAPFRSGSARSRCCLRLPPAARRSGAQSVYAAPFLRVLGGYAIRESRRDPHRRLPTSSTQRRGRPTHTLSDASPTPPKPPTGLTAAERKAWREVWSSPVSQLWTVDDHAIVLRLIRLRNRLDGDVANAPVTLFGQVAALESRLILTRRDATGRASCCPPTRAAQAARGTARGDRRRKSASACRAADGGRPRRTGARRGRAHHRARDLDELHARIDQLDSS